MNHLLEPELAALSQTQLNPAAGGAFLDANERPWDMPKELKKVLAREIIKLPFQKYPHLAADHLEKEIARFWGVGDAQILLGNGSDELIQILLMALGRRKKVVLATPTFSMYRHTASLLGMEVSEVPLKEDFSLDVNQLKKEASEESVVILCQPNNPTGNYFNEGDVKSVLENSAGHVIIDEAYGEFTGQNHTSWLAEYPHLVLMRTFSKAMGLAGLRIGYALMDPVLLETVKKAKQPFNVNSVSLTAARLALLFPDYWQKTISKTNRERDRLFAFLKSYPELEVFPSVTNFILFSVRHQKAKNLWTEMKKAKVHIRDVSDGHGLAHCLRVSVGTREENDLFLEVLARVLRKKSCYEGWPT